MVKFPEKTDLILVTDRPPQLETPLHYFKQDLTPNDAFFVRWHLSGIPTSVDLNTFRLNIGGYVNSPLSLSVEQLKKEFEPVSLIAVAQCSGNSRSFFAPRVAGGQWANGAVGNAKWTGVRLRDLLAKAGVKEKPVEVSFAGLDEPPMPEVPKFVKSLSFDHANDGEVMVAYAMNDAPLPMLNGYPLRLVVPGWFATYWVKSLSQINVLNEAFHNFWMDKAYRIPANPEGAETAQALAKDTVPINRHTVRAIFVTPEPAEKIDASKPIEIEGVAFDDGHGIAKVEVSTDGGKTWSDATLDKDLGKYSWRRWRMSWKPPGPGRFTLMARATNNAGVTQVAEQHWNRSGYQRNIIEQVEIEVQA
jgi:DMSO/TMAO reductase YedYZ molybdopterin-dependent catalytic subunit